MKFFLIIASLILISCQTVSNKIDKKTSEEEKKLSKFLNKSEENLKKIDACFISGTPIIKERIMSKLPEYTINLHLGLIPNYKGPITMFWPFLFLEPTIL